MEPAETEFKVSTNPPSNYCAIFIPRSAMLSDEGSLGYYMRFIVTGGREIGLPLLETALKQFDQAYAITDRDQEPPEVGTLTYGGALCGQIEINRRTDDPVSGRARGAVGGG
jgi:hypothetical protein